MSYRLFIFLFLSGCLFSCHPEQLPVEKGISFELAKWRKQHLDSITYTLSFHIPAFLDVPVTGTETIRFIMKSGEGDLQLDFKADPDAVTFFSVNGRVVSAEQRNGHLIIPSGILKKGMNEVKINFISPDQSLNRNKEYMYTLFVPDRASTAFPCFDQPDLKARFNLDLAIPAGWKAVANGKMETDKLSGQLRDIRFSETELLPTYLFAFSAGKYHVISRDVNGHQYTLYHREPDAVKVAQNLDAIFSMVELSVSSIEKYADMDMPFSKYDFVAVPSFQYGGMEHPGAVFFNSSRLFLEGTPTRDELLGRANLIAHETAHLWFGDLVTMPWFDEVWLKEVFANFIADQVVSPLFPDFDQQLQFLMAHYNQAYSVDRTGGTHPIGQDLGNLKDAGSLYGPVIYHKAPIVMRMLEEKIGDSALRRGLQKYLRAYAFGNAGWNDLINILDTDGNLHKWAEVWVNESGRPHLKASFSDGKTVIEQSDPMGKGRFWPQEMDIAWSVGDSVVRKRVVLNSPRTVLNNTPAPQKNQWVYLNADGSSYGFIGMNQVTLNFFCNNVSRLKDDLFRAAVWTDLYENMMEGQLAVAGFIGAIINNLPDEGNQLIRERILLYLQNAFLFRAAGTVRDSLDLSVEQLVWDELDKHENSRNSLMNTAISISDSPFAISRLYEVWKKENYRQYKLTKKQLKDLAYNLALHMPAKASQILDIQEQKIDGEDERREFAFVRKSLDPDPEKRHAFFLSLLKAGNREHEPWVNEALYYLNHPDRTPEELTYIRPGLELLEEIQATGDIFFPQSWLDNLLKGHHSKAAADSVRRFLNDHPDYSAHLKMKILKASDFLLRNNE